MKNLKYALTATGLAAMASISATPIQAATTCDASCIWQALEWSFYYVVPSTDNEANIQGMPSHKQLVPLSLRNPETEKRVLLLGDLKAMNSDTPPWVHPDIRALMASADLVLLNIEAPVTLPDPANNSTNGLDLNLNQSFNFQASEAFLRSTYAQYCIDPNKLITTVANNHAGDREQAGWDQTLASLTTMVGKPAAIVGNQVNGYAKVETIDLDNLRFGIVGWTQVENTNLENAWTRLEDVQSTTFGIKNLKSSLGIDTLIGAVHWEREFHHFPEAATQQTASNLINNFGFDIIAGHHPHVLQPLEQIDDGFVFYSLGSISANYSNFYGQLFGITEVVLSETGALVEYQVHPYVQRNNDNVLPGTIQCPDGRTVTDLSRETKWEIVPISEINNFWGTRTSLQERFDLVFPPETN